MATEKATFGPWRVDVEEGDEWWFGSGDRKQAVIRTAGEKHAAIAVGAGNTPEELATARLLAAAPELLAALEFCLGTLKAAGWGGSRAREIADEAIAKARGEA